MPSIAISSLRPFGILALLLAAPADGADREVRRAGAPAPLDYTLELSEMLPPSREGGEWFQPRPVAIPSRNGAPLAVMTIQKALGSDFFSGLSTAKSGDGGKTWSVPEEQAGLGWAGGRRRMACKSASATSRWAGIPRAGR